MHNASTKQRLSALRRKLGIFNGARWVKEPRARRAGPPGATPIRDTLAERAVAESGADRATEAIFDPPAAETLELPAFAPERAAETAPELPAFAPEPAAETEVVPAPAAMTAIVTVPAQTEIDLAPPASRHGRRVAGVFTVALALAMAGVWIIALRGAAPHEVSAATASPGLERAPPPAVLASAAAAPSAPSSAPSASTVEIRRGDTLWHVASVHLGDPARWPEVHAANAAQIRDPDLIFPGQQLRLPHAPR